MLFNSYPPGVLVSPKLHPLGEAARISQFLASRVCQQQMFPAKGGYKTFVLFQSHLSGLPGDAAFGNTEHFSQLPVEGIVIVATHDGKHITVPKDTGGISLMLDEPSQCPVHESTVSNSCRKNDSRQPSRGTVHEAERAASQRSCNTPFSWLTCLKVSSPLL